MRKPSGYAFIVSPDPAHALLNNGAWRAELNPGTMEMDTYQCGHCGTHIHLKPRESPYATCKQCMKFECHKCYGHGCRPMEKWIEQQEAKDRAIREWF